MDQLSQLHADHLLITFDTGNSAKPGEERELLDRDEWKRLPAVKSGNVYLGFADRFTGTLIITGEISDVQTAMEEIVDYFRDTLGYVVCNITKR